MANCMKQDGDFAPLEAKITRCWKGDHVVYQMQITPTNSPVSWTICKRYREFNQLHENLCKIDPTIKELSFPGKKPFNTMSKKVINYRRQELDNYLNVVLQRFPLPPPCLAHFVDWHLYEVHGITNQLSKKFFENSDLILRQGFMFEFDVLQIYAINQRLLSQSPTNLFDDPSTDFTHVMDFINRVASIKISGSTSFVGSSNIVMNKLEFDMSNFNSLECLELSNISLRDMRGFDRLKENVKFLKVSHSLDNIKNLALGDLLSLGNGDWAFGRDPVPTTSWNKVETMDLSNNFLHGLDGSMMLFKRVKTLKLNGNLLTSIANLDMLVNLRSLTLSQNKLGLTYTATEMCPGPTFRGCLGNLTELDVSNNQLESTKVLDGLYSLIKLNLSNNVIVELTELNTLSTFNCMESLLILGNPVCSKPGYRRYTLQLFGDRYKEVRLDLRVPDEVEVMHLDPLISQRSNDHSSYVSSVESFGKRISDEKGSKNHEISMDSNQIIIF